MENKQKEFYNKDGKVVHKCGERATIEGYDLLWTIYDPQTDEYYAGDTSGGFIVHAVSCRKCKVYAVVTPVQVDSKDTPEDGLIRNGLKIVNIQRY